MQKRHGRGGGAPLQHPTPQECHYHGTIVLWLLYNFLFLLFSIWKSWYIFERSTCSTCIGRIIIIMSPLTCLSDLTNHPLRFYNFCFLHFNLWSIISDKNPHTKNCIKLSFRRARKRGSQKVPSSRPGQVDFLAGQGTFHSLLLCVCNRVAPGQEMIRGEKFFKVREKSGNVILSQQKSTFWWKQIYISHN